MSGPPLDHCHLQMVPSTLNVHPAVFVMRMIDLVKALNSPLAIKGQAHVAGKSDLGH